MIDKYGLEVVCDWYWTVAHIYVNIPQKLKVFIHKA